MHKSFLRCLRAGWCPFENAAAINDAVGTRCHLANYGLI